MTDWPENPTEVGHYKNLNRSGSGYTAFKMDHQKNAEAARVQNQTDTQPSLAGDVVSENTSPKVEDEGSGNPENGDAKTEDGGFALVTDDGQPIVTDEGKTLDVSNSQQGEGAED